MSQAVAGTGRGVVTPGEFAWTQPQEVHGCAHILHFPAGNVPNALYWLLHYCGRAVVVGVHPGPVDWPNLGQQAYDAFGVDCFIRGHFGVQLSNKVVRYGQHLHTPPHGAIVHLVKVPPVPPATNHGWDPPPDPVPLRCFEYDICMGPRGEVPITRLQGEAVGRGPAQPHASRRPPTTERPAEVSALAKQVETVATQLQALTTRLEDAGVLGAAPVIAATAAGPVGPAVTDPRRDDHSSAHRVSVGQLVVCLALHRLPSTFAWLACISIALPVGFGDGESDSSAGSPVPDSPSEPDLTDLSAPTPRTRIQPRSERTEVAAYVRPSDDELARTSAPQIGSIGCDVPAFQVTDVPAIQRRVLAALSEVDIERPPVPYIPAGCPVVILLNITAR